MCGTKFYESESLTKHNLHNHTGQKSFNCATCGLKYSRNESMERHISTLGKEELLVCDSCG